MSGGFGSGNQVERRLTDVEKKLRGVSGSAGVLASLGSFSLTSDGVAVSTVVADANVSGTSLIFYTPSNAGGWSVDGALDGITPGSGSFVVAHAASTLARSYNYAVINPA